MRRKQIPVVATLFLWGLICVPVLAQDEPRKPILLDTDIGADIDDSFALVLAFGSHELDVRGITTVGDDTHKKAMMVCRFLTVTGRRHTRVAAGENPQPARPLTDLFKYYYHPDPIFDRTTKPEKEAAEEFLYGRVKQQPGKVTLVALGPLTNIARLIEKHADSVDLIDRIIFMESNVAMDAAAARTVVAANIPLVVVSAEVCRNLTLDDAGVNSIFSVGTALSRQVQTMYQMWDRHNPPLGESLAVALCFDERFAVFERRSLVVDQQGALQENEAANDAAKKARVVTSIKSAEFVKWYVQRMSSLVSPSRRTSKPIAQGGMPYRVHVAEDFENDIERFWWMSGKAETKLLRPESRRACRGVLTHDFDDLLMMSREMHSAVVFNPVPGPPMGKNTRLSFRYWVKGTDAIRVQIYSLTNGYHRQLVVKDLPQGKWQHATVDMTEARRPDGTGGPLGENERIDDIQFYVDPDAEVVIDDIVLFDAAIPGENRPFPKRIMFAGLFDTGSQGKEWPGDFEIVDDAGNFWKAAKSIDNKDSGAAWIRLGLRGQRTLAGETHVSFRYRLKGTA
ncbi:MAG: inosine-uridine nucleoside N-ribohydrolase, partial [Pirellulaceae bacterium]